MNVMASGRSMAVRLVQFLKASLPMLVTLSGIATDVSFSQKANVLSGISVRLDGSEAVVSELSPANTPMPNDVTAAGMCSSRRSGMSANARPPIVVVPSGSVSSRRPVRLKQRIPKVVTLSGMLISVRRGHSENA